MSDESSNKPKGVEDDGLNIYKRKDGRWEGRYLKYPPAKKATKYGYVYGDSYESVAAKLKRYTDVDSFSAVFEEWLVFKKPLVKLSTFSRYRNVGNAYLIPAFGDKRINTISRADITRFSHDLMTLGYPSGASKPDNKYAPKNNTGGLSASTINGILGILKNVFEFATQEKEIPEITDLHRVSVKERHKPLRVLSVNEQKRLSAFLIESPDPASSSSVTQPIDETSSSSESPTDDGSTSSVTHPIDETSSSSVNASSSAPDEDDETPINDEDDEADEDADPEDVEDAYLSSGDDGAADEPETDEISVYRNFGILLCLYTGLRIGELCALKWGDIDLNDQSLYVHKTLQRIKKPSTSSAGEAKTKVIITDPKSSTSIRTIPIPDEIFPIIKEMRETVKT